jgi:hypothetical protein
VPGHGKGLGYFFGARGLRSAQHRDRCQEGKGNDRPEAYSGIFVHTRLVSASLVPQTRQLSALEDFAHPHTIRGLIT